MVTAAELGGDSTATTGRVGLIRTIIAIADGDTFEQEHLAAHGDRPVRDRLRSVIADGELAITVDENPDLDDDEIGWAVERFNAAADIDGGEKALRDWLGRIRSQPLARAILAATNSWTRRMALSFDLVTGQPDIYSVQLGADLLNETLSTSGTTDIDRGRIDRWFQTASERPDDDTIAGVDTLDARTLRALSAAADRLSSLASNWNIAPRQRLAERLVDQGADRDIIDALHTDEWNTYADLVNCIAEQGLDPDCDDDAEFIATLDSDQIDNLIAAATDARTVAALCWAAQSVPTLDRCHVDDTAVLAELLDIDPSRAGAVISERVDASRWDLISQMPLGHLDDIDSDTILEAIDNQFGGDNERWVAFAALGDVADVGDLTVGDYIANIIAVTAER